MAERDPATGRFRPSAAAPPPEPALEAEPAPPAPGTGSARPVLFVLEDVRPSAAAPPPEPALEAEPAPPAPSDVRLVTLIARGLNAGIAAALPGCEAPEDAVEEVGEKAAPVIRRAATRLGGSGLVERTAPIWVVELAELGGAVAGAWGGAIAEAVRRGFSRRRHHEEGYDAGPARAGDDPGRIVRRSDRVDRPEAAEPAGAELAPPAAGGAGRELREAYARGLGRR